MKSNRFLIFTIGVILIIFSVFMLFARQDNGSDQKQEVLLFFSNQNAMYLESKNRMVDRENIYQNTIQALIEGPESTYLNKTIPEGTKLLNIEVNDGLARINFNQKLRENHWGGSTGERMTVYSLVNTLTQFEEIDRVQIMISGKEIETLVGHMDLSRPLTENRKIINSD